MKSARKLHDESSQIVKNVVISARSNVFKKELKNINSKLTGQFLIRKLSNKSTQSIGLPKRVVK